MSSRVWTTPEALELAQAACTTDPETGIRKLARTVLAENLVQTVPVPIQHLCSWGCVRKIKQMQTVLEGGLTQTSDGGFEIVLRAESSQARRRFSLAHEFGHILFYKYAPAAKRARQLSKECAPEEEERLCNVAAEELLMPDWYLKTVAAQAPSAAAAVLQVMTDCQTSASAAMFRVARYWPHPGELQLWRRTSGADWQRAHSRGLGKRRQSMADYVIEAWDDRGVPEAGGSRTDIGFIYSRAARQRLLAKADAIQPAHRRDLLIVSLQIQTRIPDATPTLERARQERVRRALASTPLHDCRDCGGTGWTIRSEYDPARRLEPSSLCHCRYDRRTKNSA